MGAAGLAVGERGSRRRRAEAGAGAEAEAEGGGRCQPAGRGGAGAGRAGAGAGAGVARWEPPGRREPGLAFWWFLFIERRRLWPLRRRGAQVNFSALDPWQP